MLATFARSSSRKCFARSLASQAGAGSSSRCFAFCFSMGNVLLYWLCSQHELPSCDMRAHVNAPLEKKRPPKMHYPTITPFSWFVYFATSTWGFPLSTLGAWNLPVWKLVLGEENSSLPGSPNSFFIIPFILLKESLVEQLPIYGRHRKVKE